MPNSSHLPSGTIVITGARRGIGHGLLERFLCDDRQVIAVVRPGQKLSVSANASEVKTVFADLSCVADLSTAVEQIIAALGGLSIAALINAAGDTTPLQPVDTIKSEVFLERLTLMAVAPTVLTTGLAPHMASGARVLNLSSRAAVETFPGFSAYCMSKHALYSATRSLQLELPDQIAVSYLLPGEVDTDMQKDLRESDPEIFPMVEFFIRNQINLIPVSIVVTFIYWVITATESSTFVREEGWYIYDTIHHKQWLPVGTSFDYPEP